jgi:hypothetical protein
MPRRRHWQQLHLPLPLLHQSRVFARRLLAKNPSDLPPEFADDEPLHHLDDIDMQLSAPYVVRWLQAASVQ